MAWHIQSKRLISIKKWLCILWTDSLTISRWKNLAIRAIDSCFIRVHCCGKSKYTGKRQVTSIADGVVYVKRAMVGIAIHFSITRATDKSMVFEHKIQFDSIKLCIDTNMVYQSRASNGCFLSLTMTKKKTFRDRLCGLWNFDSLSFHSIDFYFVWRKIRCLPFIT